MRASKFWSKLLKNREKLIKKEGSRGHSARKICSCGHHGKGAPNPQAIKGSLNTLPLITLCTTMNDPQIEFV